MRETWTKAELFEAVDAARSKVTNSTEYEALRYLRLIAVRVLRHRGMHEILGEEIINGIRVDRPGVKDEPQF